MALPIAFSIVLKVLTKPVSEGISISGAGIFFTIPMPLQNFIISESQVNSAMVLITIFFFCLYMTHGLKEKIELKRQHFAELIVEKVDGLVNENMGEYFSGYSPFIIAIMAYSACCSLLSLFGLYAPTSDINIVGGWAILVFILITYYKMKCGPLYYLKGFTEPVALLAPINFISEFATPISMAFRHYGNILSGSVISVLLGTALAGLSNMIFNWLPGFLGDFPFLQVGIPAVLSIYFDVFSGLLQAFIFAMLTMLNVSGGLDIDEYEKRKLKKAQKALENK
ncbi:MAG: F0F1 ATP synthase subunit A [Ruminococcaceae bacterium]|nr:F0F1 ATP synthase subunit A [Oscillospiraceae bacterium]